MEDSFLPAVTLGKLPNLLCLGFSSCEMGTGLLIAPSLITVNIQEGNL